MTKQLTSLMFLLTIILVSCKKSDTIPNATSSNIDKQLLLGVWYPVIGQFDYKSRTIKIDSLFFADGSNLGFGTITGKWWWGNGDTVIYSQQTPIVNKTWEHIFKLTNDSLVVISSLYPTKFYRYHR